MKFDWIPLKRVGPFIFNAHITGVLSKYPLVECKEESDAMWKTYAMRRVNDERMRIHCDNSGAIVSIACHRSLIYKKKNLIGLDFKEFCRVVMFSKVKEDDVIFIDDAPQKVYEFDQLEAQVWTKDDVVVTIFASSRQESVSRVDSPKEKQLILNTFI